MKSNIGCPFSLSQNVFFSSVTGQNAKGEAVLDAINGIPVTLHPPSLPLIKVALSQSPPQKYLTKCHRRWM